MVGGVGGVSALMPGVHMIPVQSVWHGCYGRSRELFRRSTYLVPESQSIGGGVEFGTAPRRGNASPNRR